MTMTWRAAGGICRAQPCATRRGDRPVGRRGSDPPAGHTPSAGSNFPGLVGHLPAVGRCASERPCRHLAAPQLGPGRCCSPRHVMPFQSINEGLRRGG